MPAIILQLLRWVVVAAIQTGAIVAVSNILENIVDLIRDNLQQYGGINKSETDGLLSDSTIEILTMLGVTVASLKTKIPLRLVDKLGLTVARGAGKVSTPATIQKVATAEAKIAQGISLKRTFLVALVGSLGASIPWLP